MSHRFRGPTENHGTIATVLGGGCVLLAAWAAATAWLAPSMKQEAVVTTALRVLMFVGEPLQGLSAFLETTQGAIYVLIGVILVALLGTKERLKGPGNPRQG